MDATVKTPDVPTPQAPAEKTGPPETIVMGMDPKPTDPNIPLEQYAQENDNNPYSSKFFALDTPFNYLPAAVQDKMKDIDKFVDREIADRGWKHTINSYQQVLSDTLLELGTVDGEVLDQIDRIHGYATNILKLDGLDEVRKTIKGRLRRMQTKKDMDNLILKEIGKKII